VIERGRERQLDDYLRKLMLNQSDILGERFDWFFHAPPCDWLMLLCHALLYHAGVRWGLTFRDNVSGKVRDNR